MQPSPNHIVLLCRNRSVWRFGLLLLLLLLPQLQLSLVQSQDAAAGTGTCEVDVADGTCRPNNPLVEEDSLHQHEEKTRDEHHDSEEADDSASTAGRSRDQSSLSSYNFSFVDGYLVVDKELGVQQLYDPSLRGKFEERWQQTLEYMQDRKPKFGDDKGETPLIECLLKHESCLAWSLRDECDSNPGYMKMDCAPACFSCEYLSVEGRCPIDADWANNNTWGPGDLNTMFERILTLGTSSFNTKIHAPNQTDNDAPQGQLQVLSRPTSATDTDGPWVVVVDDFLTELECESLIQLGTDRGFEASLGLDKTPQADGTYGSTKSMSRTSTNTWCLDVCYHNDTTQGVLRKIEALTGIPDANAEYLQLLYYQEGQYYMTHNDYIDFHVERAQGVRLITVFLYLNDVEEGGGTNFPRLNITVEAKRGRALIWPSVLNDDPNARDDRTDHQALPVVKGIKYAANAWMHQRDFKAPFTLACT